MGWAFNWASSNSNDFNYELPSVLHQRRHGEGQVYYNYEVTDASTEDLPAHVFSRTRTARVPHLLSNASWRRAPVSAPTCISTSRLRARRERPNYNLMDWVKRHDEYENGSAAKAPRVNASAGEIAMGVFDAVTRMYPSTKTQLRCATHTYSTMRDCSRWIVPAAWDWR